VMSQIDSRTILDTGGAEKLLGNGDMLYMPVGVNKPVRIQGAFIRSSEIRSVIDFLKKHSAADYSEEMIAEMEKRAAPEKGNAGDGDEDDSSEDPMFKTAVEVIMDAGQASTSLLQRRCKLGYARAARIMDEMEQAHIIGPYEGSKPRQLLISRQQWIEMTMQRADDSTPDIL
ncbi:MAG: DNA translocase FtsK, partial [Ruthenibacterium sp.]